MVALAAPVVRAGVARRAEGDALVSTGQHVGVRALADANLRIRLVLAYAYAGRVSTAIAARCSQGVGYWRADDDVVVVALAAPVVCAGVARRAEGDALGCTGQDVGVRTLSDCDCRNAYVLCKGYTCSICTSIDSCNPNTICSFSGDTCC